MWICTVQSAGMCHKNCTSVRAALIGTFAFASKGLPFCCDKTCVQHLGSRPGKVAISDGLTMASSTYEDLHHRLESWDLVEGH